MDDLEKLEKMAAGEFYVIDEKRKVIIYDPQCNNYGKWDYDINGTTNNMAEIAEKKNMPVEAEFNRTKFQIQPGMTAQDGIEAWKKQMEIDREAYLKSPEYKARQAQMEKERAAQKAKEALDDKLIRDEVLDVEGFKHYFDYMVKRNSKDDYGKGIISYAMRWGKLMQAEMKKQGLDHLTEKLVRDTDKRADIYGMSGASASMGRNLLITTWKHGEELAKIEGMDMDDVAFFRALNSDRTKEFCDKYKPTEPKDFDDALTKGGMVIAAVLQDEKLVDMFYENLSDPAGFSEEKLHEYIPALKLPDNDWRTLHDACVRAKKQIKETKANAAEGKGRGAKE